MVERKAIADFFDRVSVDRDLVLSREPVLAYEQQMRERSLIELLDPQPTEHVLDVGCGNARDGRVIAPHVAGWVGVDISLLMLKEGRHALIKEKLPAPLVLGDATRLPFDDSVFDKVYCSEVIEHIPEWRGMLPEMRRVLRPGGLVVLTTPNRLSLYRPIRTAADVGRRLLKIRREHPYDEWKSLREVQKALSDAGFEPKQALGVCFIPGHWTYALPHWAQRAIVGLVRGAETYLRRTVPWGGYIVAASAVRPGRS